jgi:PHD/YefM family antitoxin component YafN of YafNO toxin-antitoxin module
MKSTNPKTLRAQMKAFLDLAAREPLRILRRSGDSYILINERRFSDLQEELVTLQRRLLSVSSGAEEVKKS